MTTKKKTLTLLEKAKMSKRRQYPVLRTDEHLELALGWLKDEIGLAQVNEAMGKDGQQYSGNILYHIAVWLRECYRQGKIKIKNKR